MVELWGKDLSIELDNIYQREARYCIIFISNHYKEKIWTNHELRSALAAIQETDNEYILPIKLDDTEIPGIRLTLVYIDGIKKSPKEICNSILKKLGVDNNSEILNNDNNDDDDDIFLPNIPRTISDLEKKKFLKSSFIEIRNFFQNALIKLKKANKFIETDFEEVTSSKFAASVYVEKQLKAQCKIWIGGMWGVENSISFAEGTRNLNLNNDHSLNDSATITDDGKEIYFEILGMSFGHLEGIEGVNLKHAYPKDVAKYYWARFKTT